MARRSGALPRGVRAPIGNVLNADNAATLFDEYNADRARYREAVHEAATWIRDELFSRALTTRMPEGRNRVVFTAGGNAAGKSTALAVTGISQQAQVVFDSTLSNPEHARRLLEQALNAVKSVSIVYVTRSLDEIFPAMLERYCEEGRVVSISQMVNSHRGAAQAVGSLMADFAARPGVEFILLDNSVQGVREGTVDLAALPDYTKSRERLHEYLQREYLAGRITREIYDLVRR